MDNGVSEGPAVQVDAILMDGGTKANDVRCVAQSRSGAAVVMKGIRRGHGGRIGGGLGVDAREVHSDVVYAANA